MGIVQTKNVNRCQNASALSTPGGYVPNQCWNLDHQSILGQGRQYISAVKTEAMGTETLAIGSRTDKGQEGTLHNGNNSLCFH